MTLQSSFKTATMASGVQVVGQHIEGVESAALGILIGSGARNETGWPGGVSRFTEQMMFRGTEDMSARELSERFDSLGIEYASTAGIESTLFSAVMVGTRLPDAVQLLSEVVARPALPEEAVEPVRVQLLQERKQREDKPIQRVFDLLRRRHLEGSPMANDLLGTEESLHGMRREDLVAYWCELYTASNSAVSVAGKFDWDQVTRLLEGATGEWGRGSGRRTFETPRPVASVNIFEKDTTVEHLGMAFPGVPISDPRYFAASLLAQVLGGGTNSRLHQEVREKRGLAYTAAARFDALDKTGMFRIYVGTSADRAHESVEVVLQELDKLEREGVTDDELRLAKIRLKSNVIMRSESTSARMNANLRSWWFEGRLYDLSELRDRIDAVTLSDVADLTASTAPSRNLTVVALGPRSEQELLGDAVLSRA